MGGRACVNRRRRREGACGGPVHVARKKTGPDGRQLRRCGDRSGTYRVKQGKSWACGPRHT
jgi:hypothetical protein